MRIVSGLGVQGFSRLRRLRAAFLLVGRLAEVLASGTGHAGMAAPRSFDETMRPIVSQIPTDRAFEVTQVLYLASGRMRAEGEHSTLSGSRRSAN